MSATFDNVYVEKYESRVRHLAQQSKSRLRNFVQEVSDGGEAHNFDRMAANDANKKTTRKTPTPDDETAASRRKSIPSEYHIGDVVEKKDLTRAIVDPKSNYAMAHGMAMGRAQDDEIIAAATGASRDGAGNSVSFLAGQTVGNGSAAITFDIVTEVSEIFLNNDIDPEEPKVMVISPAQQRKLLQLTEATSRDYNLRDALMRGYVDLWMGYTWIVSTRLLAPSAGQVDCFAMTNRAIGLQMNRDVTVDVGPDPSISFAWRIYTSGEWGAVRVEDEQLVRIHLSETI
jgi:hypothetical protein